MPINTLQKWALFNVIREYGRRGIGGALIDRVFDQARHRELSKVFLRTFREVEWNAPFYARLGFVPIEERDWSEEMLGIAVSEDEWGLCRELRAFMGIQIAPITVPDHPGEQGCAC